MYYWLLLFEPLTSQVERYTWCYASSELLEAVLQHDGRALERGGCGFHFVQAHSCAFVRDDRELDRSGTIPPLAMRRPLLNRKDS
jgi:hypothetical protein